MSGSIQDAEERPAVRFQFGGFTYDSGSRLLTCGGEKRHLSSRAQQLLHLLLAARPRALSREELYDALWPSTFVSETNLAGVVKEVRRALGDDAREPQYIRTVHGFGYAFEDEAAPMPSRQIVATLVCGEKSYPLYSGSNSIGRALDAVVVLAENTISRRHAIITIHEGEASFQIEDLESKNGTFIDGKPIGPVPVIVPACAQLEFGAVRASVRFRTSTTKSLRLDLSEVKRLVAARMVPA